MVILKGLRMYVCKYVCNYMYIAFILCAYGILGKVELCTYLHMVGNGKRWNESLIDKVFITAYDWHERSPLC